MMVAYSFNKEFVSVIESGQKRQTIRAHRKGHARPGEMLQLYTGMRTRACRKIVPDVRCMRVDEVWFDLSCMANVAAPPATHAEFRTMIDSRSFEITVNGIPLERCCFNGFAILDGFGDGYWLGNQNHPVQPFDAMLMFWMVNHGATVFNGVIIGWEPIK